MTHKTALYVLLAALALAALTNRWVAGGGSRPGFNIVGFDEVFFGAQWIAFGLTLGGLALLGSQWFETGKFPALILLGVALVCFFVATGIPQTTQSYRWKAGDVGLTRWMKTSSQSREADKVAPELIGTWRLASLSAVIERDNFTMTHRGETKAWSRATCGESFKFDFAYATGHTLGYHPSIYKYHDLLDGTPIPSLYAVCNYRVYAFLKLSDGRLLTVRDPHRDDVEVAFLTR
ncbi:MAG TPA: hypothetical protein VGP71_09640 [Burkholderiales bacterium]|nr:hypothetical protein [Burkholderiales bacterium]